MVYLLTLRVRPCFTFAQIWVDMLKQMTDRMYSISGHLLQWYLSEIWDIFARCLSVQVQHGVNLVFLFLKILQFLFTLVKNKDAKNVYLQCCHRRIIFVSPNNNLSFVL